jgi:prephenate dehydrogenase
MQRVAIVGLGLMGASIGLGLRRWSSENVRNGQPALEVFGFDSNLDRQGQAKKLGAVDRTEWELRKSVKDADLIVVAAPVLAVREILADVAPLVKDGVAITDVASTKAEVLRWSTEILPSTANFIGGHPMAGKTDSIEGADPNIFQGATWCVSPSVTASDEAIRTVLGMINALGAEPFFVDPNEHDAFVAGISHLPAILSAALMNSLSADPSWRDMKSLTAGAFKDMTRLAGGSPTMHRDIVLTNRPSIRRWLNTYVEHLDAVGQLLDSESEDSEKQLLEFFTNARDRRAEWAVQTSREHEMLTVPSSDDANGGLSGQMGRMLFGGFLRKPRVAKGAQQREQVDQHAAAPPGSGGG